MTATFVYIVDREGELDVYEDLSDAEEACQILDPGGDKTFVFYQEQVVFRSSKRDPATRNWLNELRKSKEEEQ